MLSPEWLKAFVSVGTIRSGRWTAFGAGVFLHSPPVVWLVTAAHVLKAAGAEHVGVVIHRRDGSPVPLDLTAIQAQHSTGWVLDETRDVAATLMALPPDCDIKAVAEDRCIPVERLVPSMLAYTVGCPYGIACVDPRKVQPLVLGGIISGVDVARREIFCSAPTFPGNSGGPLIVEIPPYNPEGGRVVGPPTVLLAGVVRELTLIKPSNTEALPLHLGICVAVDVIQELLKSDPARGMLKKLGFARS